MHGVPPAKLAEWRARAARKEAIVPADFEVFPTFADLACGHCRHLFRRNLVPNLDEPVLACPQCQARNWLPIQYSRGEV